MELPRIALDFTLCKSIVLLTKLWPLGKNTWNRTRIYDMEHHNLTFKLYSLVTNMTGENRIRILCMAYRNSTVKLQSLTKSVWKTGVLPLNYDRLNIL